ncbi:hypothetical protein [Sandaracinus amylolyticus]|uniref:hypothetical protein n=1 Tax=Sandaracinus amylolyticus TaxID=927083 RepID=UPI001F176672|nr:hypothetical protein [Sandaracinus amylolyticus]
MWLVVVTALVCDVSSASAQAWESEAIELARAGRASEAIERLEHAESDEVRARGELVTLHALRAELRDALGAHDAARIDLRRLAALEPGRDLPASATLELRRALDEERAALGGGLAIDVDVQRAAGRAVVRVHARHAPNGLVQDVRVSARSARDGRWQVLHGDEVTVPVEPLDTLELAVELLGPRGIVLATRGTASSPERFAGTPAGEVATTEPSGGDDTLVWVVGVSVGVLVVTAAVLGLVSTVGSQQSDHTAVDGPIVRF